MDLEDLLLKKEELSIRRETDFVVPIYPALLRTEIQLDPQIAHRVFAQAAQEYHQELNKHIETMKDEEEKKWYQDVFLRDPTVKPDERGRQFILNGMWEDYVLTSKTGFARALANDGVSGGSLYYNSDDSTCRGYVYPPVVQFSLEKFEAYSIKKISQPGGIAYKYSSHNIDNFPQALFLRNWAILYLNEVMRELDRQGKL